MLAITSKGLDIMNNAARTACRGFYLKLIGVAFWFKAYVGRLPLIRTVLNRDDNRGT